jgi:hypothetical protein
MPALQKLPVFRETYCSESMVDQAVDFMEKHAPEKLEAILDELKTGDRHGLYNRRILSALGYLSRSEARELVPETSLGKIDLMYEISRRLAVSNGLLDLYLEGKPIVGGDGRLAPLADLKPARSVGAGLCDELEEAVAQEVYKLRPDILIEQAEQLMRCILLPSIDGVFYSFLRKDFSQKRLVPEGLGASGELLNCLRTRVRKMMVG